MASNSNKKRMNQEGVRLLFKSCFRNKMFALVPYEVWRDFIVAQLDSRTIGKFVQLSKGCKKIAQELCLDFLDSVEYYGGKNQFCVAVENLFKAKICFFNDAKIQYQYTRDMLVNGIKRAKPNEMNACCLVFKK
jgi:hypothetical protein